MESKRDLRLYHYNSGQLQRVGSGKTGVRPHIFEDYESCVNFTTRLRDKYIGYRETQFVIVEYFGTYNSKIVNVLSA